MATGRARRTTDPDAARLRRVLPDTSGLAALRAEVRAFLVACGVSASTADAVLLALTELATNGFEAAGDGARVRVHVDCSAAATVSLVVSNEPPTWPATPDGMRPVTMPSATAERGRGLPLVAALAARLSIDSDDEGTNVRADFAR